MTESGGDVIDEHYACRAAFERVCAERDAARRRLDERVHTIYLTAIVVAVLGGFLVCCAIGAHAGWVAFTAAVGVEAVLAAVCVAGWATS